MLRRNAENKGCRDNGSSGIGSRYSGGGGGDGSPLVSNGFSSAAAAAVVSTGTAAEKAAEKPSRKPVKASFAGLAEDSHFQHGKLRGGREPKENGDDNTHQPESMFFEYGSGPCTVGGGSPSGGSPTADVVRLGGLAMMNSGPSAIDLFDQCGLVPTAAADVKGLVGMTRSLQGSQCMENDNADSAMDDGRRTKVSLIEAPVPAEMRPPLAPGAAAGIRRRAHQASPRGYDAAARNVVRRGHHGAESTTKKLRPPFVGGTLPSSMSRASPLQALPGKGGREAVAGNSNKLRRDRRSDIGFRGSREDHQEGSTPVQSSTGPVINGTKEEARASDRVRRRWNSVDDGAHEATGASTPVKGGESGDEEGMPEDRLISAKTRLHKNKDLEALKSEHVEALSILQDISAPSTAIASGSKAADEDGEDSASQETARRRLRDKRSSEAPSNVADHYNLPSSAHPTCGVEDGQPEHPNADFDALSTDLPRIGSPEQAVLRSLYRKWWMKVANGASPPVSTPDMPKGCEQVGVGLVTAGFIAETSTEPGTTKDMGGQGVSENSAENGMTESAQLDSAAETGTGAAVNHASGMVVISKTTEEESDGKCVPPVAEVDVSSTTMIGKRRGPMAQEATTEEEISLPKGEKRLTELTGVVSYEPSLAAKGESSVYAHNDSEFDRPLPVVADDLCALKDTQASQLEATSSVGVIVGAVTTEPPEISDNPRHEGVIQTLKDSSIAPVPHTLPQSDVPDAVGSADLPRNAGLEPLSKEEGAEGVAALAASGHPVDSDVESVPDDDGLTAGEEEGLHGRIYLPDGRFVSTRHDSTQEAATEENSEGEVAAKDSVWSDYGDEEFEV